MDSGERVFRLVAIKSAHTVIWLFFVACIIGIPIAGYDRQFQWATVLIGIVLIECAVLAFNRGRCPFSAVVARYTDNRDDGFDIYLPGWVARYNSIIFGSLFAAGSLFDLFYWLILRRNAG